jgi:hypothetical protein
VGGAVVLGGRQQSDIVREMEALHEIRDELLGRETSQGAVFRGDDDVEPPSRRGDELSPGEAVQRRSSRNWRDPERLLGVAGREEIASARREGVDIVSRMQELRIGFHSRKLADFGDLRE